MLIVEKSRSVIHINGCLSQVYVFTMFDELSFFIKIGELLRTIQSSGFEQGIDNIRAVSLS